VSASGMGLMIILSFWLGAAGDCRGAWLGGFG
jgi:hypothetical protein